jgi:transcriptional regulator with XRE-family HTH domain
MTKAEILTGIKTQMGILSMNQKTLAEKIGMTQPQLSRILRGLNDPSVSSLIKICEAIGMTVYVV